MFSIMQGERIQSPEVGPLTGQAHTPTSVGGYNISLPKPQAAGPCISAQAMAHGTGAVLSLPTSVLMAI